MSLLFITLGTTPKNQNVATKTLKNIISLLINY